MSISYRGVTAGTAFTFLGTSTIQTLRIPNGVNLIEVYLWGAGGKSGGAGGFVSGKLSVVPNQTLQIIVGVVSDINGAVLAKGGGGGYQNFRSVGFGGGFSGVFSAFPTQLTALAIAGGGGGGTGVGGGGGGYPSGANGSANGGNSPGTGGTQTAGGTGGSGSGGNGSPGVALAGGNGSGANDFSAGSGGGGWFGGGGGRNGSGAGGGSSYIDKLIDATFTNGGSGTNVTGPAQTNPYWQSPAGNTNSSGLVVIVYANVFPLYNVIRLNPTAVVVSQSRVFSATGSIQTFTVPANVTAIRFFLWGSGGTGQNGVTNVNTAGGGAFVEGNLFTTPGTVYNIIVGRRGVTGLANGGGTTGGTTAGGGGFSGIFSGSPAANTVIAIAGGGAGSGFNARGFGGGGGYPSGASGTGSGSQGGGGTQIAGGSSTFAAGTQLAGGNGGGLDNGGGGGGGGWYGGGGGNSQGAGGGGSSTYISSVINPITSNGGNGGVSQVTPTPAGGETSPYWISPFGRAGQNGLVVIGFSPTLPRLRMSSFTPAKFSDLALWLDAADASTLVLSGTNVTQWNDKSGGGFNAVQTTATYYPTYNSATRTISCSNNGTNPQWLDVPQGMQTTQPCSIFAVVSWTQYSASGYTFLDKRKAASLTPLYQITGQGVAFRDNSTLTNTSWTLAQNTRSIIGVQGTLNVEQTYVNGTIAASLTNTFNMPAADTFTFRIGALNDPSNVPNVATFSASSLINEVLVYNAFLTGDQRQQVEGYLARKWGLLSSLPNSNIYKTFQPPP